MFNTAFLHKIKEWLISHQKNLLLLIGVLLVGGLLLKAVFCEGNFPSLPSRWLSRFRPRQNCQVPLKQCRRGQEVRSQVWNLSFQNQVRNKAEPTVLWWGAAIRTCII